MREIADSSRTDIEDVAKTDLGRACALARDLVAEHPDDEGAALLLRRMIQRLAHSLSDRSPRASGPTAAIAEASRLLASGSDEEAEILLRRHLAANSQDTAAMRLMADIARRCGFHDNAERILRRALEYDPGSAEIWTALGDLLFEKALAEDRIGDVEGALATFEKALEIDADFEPALSKKANVLVRLRRLGESPAAFKRLLDAHPTSAVAWVNYGYVLKTLGRFGEAVAAYRTAAALEPSNGSTWWNLANLQLAKFFPADIDQMESSLGGSTIEGASRVEMHFALAKAYDGRREYGEAARHLATANVLQNEARPHDAEAVTRAVSEAVGAFSRDFFLQRRNWGHEAANPIFIVGMPRSGSTLTEQILASHSAIEGTEELFAVQQIVAELGRARGHGEIADIEILDEAQFRALGERYLNLARPHRHTDRPRFTDKNPANWRNIGLIHTMLPNAKIVDVRRDPLDCCFANYSQHFSWGIEYSYDQRDLASYYRNYLRLMRHFDEVLPGRVHRIVYEDLVDDVEKEVRRLLAYLDLPFEEKCLRFFETDRAVLTPSAEQVRKPINRRGMGRWRSYEPWIGDLQQALGDTLENWRD